MIRRAGLGIGAPEDHARNARLHDGAGTHRARFNGYVQDSTNNPMVSKTYPSSSKSHNFRVSAGVVVGDTAVVPVSNDFSSYHNDSTDRDFPSRLRDQGLFQGGAHERLVAAHALPFRQRAQYPPISTRAKDTLKSHSRAICSFIFSNSGLSNSVTCPQPRHPMCRCCRRGRGS